MLAVHIASHRLSIQQTALPTRAPGFALIRPSLAGICNTDLELLRGYYHFSGISGHEFVGTVLESDNPAWLRRRVVGEINLACGDCDFCCRNLPNHCRNRSVMGILRHPGAFAECLTLPEANLHLVPDSVSDREAVFVEPIAAACQIMRQVPLNSSDLVAVLGDGKLGLLVAQVLVASQVPVVLYGKHEAKLEIARAAGATVAPTGTQPNANYRFVVECTGAPAGLQAAIAMSAPRGTVIMKSTVHAGVNIDTAPVIVNELSLIGSRCGPFEPAIRLLQEKKIDVHPMISAEFELADAAAAFAEAERPGVLKVLLHNHQRDEI